MTKHTIEPQAIDQMYDDYDEPLDKCPNCHGEGYVWGCFEDCCACTDDDGLGCAPSRCDWCRPVRKKAPDSSPLSQDPTHG